MSVNTERLKLVAQALGDLGGRVVFVGGCVAQLYATDSAASEARATDDVDCVVNLSSYADYNKFSKLLRERHFSNSMRPGDPICRWTFQDEIVDIMPFEDSPIGPSNRWYKPGMHYKKVYELSQGITIQLLPVIYYLATKLEALRSRGGNDLRFSHDFEDLVYVLNYSKELESQLAESSDESLKSYLHEQFQELVGRPYIKEEIMSSLPYGESSEVEKVLQVMNIIIELSCN